MKKNNLLFFIITTLVIIITSCSPVKDIAYLQQVGITASESDFNKRHFDARIKPKDILAITVVSSEPEASRRFNLVAPQVAESSVVAPYSQPIIQNYLVDNEGNINFPVLGILQVKGLNMDELEMLLKNKLTPYFINEMPIITIRMINYSVNVLGEVNRPGRFVTSNGQITIFEGLAMASDMTIYGRRDNVKVLREEIDGTRKIYTLNLNDKNIINSPAFFLEQNDVVYVEPNKSRTNASKFGAAESYRISTLSVLISLASLAATIYSITKR